MINLDSILKRKDITLPTKFHIVKVMGFPIVMYGCKSWTIEKAKCWRIDAFELWCWRMQSSLECKEIQSVYPKGNQSGILTGRTEAEAETQTPIFSHLMWRTDSLEKTLMLGKMEGGRRKGRQRVRCLDDITDWLEGHEFEQAPGVRDEQGSIKHAVLQSMGSQRVGYHWATELKFIKLYDTLVLKFY